jgi:hypothetical protein
MAQVVECLSNKWEAEINPCPSELKKKKKELPWVWLHT